jgi:hypothetical protein
MDGWMDGWMDGFIHSFMGPFVLLASFPFSLRPYSFIRWFVRLLVRCFVRSFIHLQFRVGVEDEGLDAGVLHKAQQRHDQHRVVPQLLVRLQRLAAELLERTVAALSPPRRAPPPAAAAVALLAAHGIHHALGDPERRRVHKLLLRVIPKHVPGRSVYWSFGAFVGRFID